MGWGFTFAILSAMVGRTDKLHSQLCLKVVVGWLHSMALCLNRDDFHPHIIGFEVWVFVFPNCATTRKQPEDTKRSYNMKQVYWND